MLLLPSQLTVIPWHYFTVRIISKWNEMYPDLRLAPNVHEYKASATEFVAVGVSYDEFNRMVVWGLRDGLRDLSICCRTSDLERWFTKPLALKKSKSPYAAKLRDLLPRVRHMASCLSLLR